MREENRILITLQVIAIRSSTSFLCRIRKGTSCHGPPEGGGTTIAVPALTAAARARHTIDECHIETGPRQRAGLKPCATYPAFTALLSRTPENRDVSGHSQWVARGHNGVGARLQKEPGAGRRTEDRDVGLAIAIEVAGDRHVAGDAQPVQRRKSCSWCSTAAGTTSRWTADRPPGRSCRRRRSRPARRRRRRRAPLERHETS